MKGVREKDIGKTKMKKGGRDFSAGCEMQIHCRREANEDCVFYMSCRKCIIINIKTRCLHSIRFSLKNFWSWALEGCSSSWRVKKGRKNKETRLGDSTKAQTVLSWDGTVFSNHEWPAERVLLILFFSLCKSPSPHLLLQQTPLLKHSFLPQLGTTSFIQTNNNKMSWWGATPEGPAWSTHLLLLSLCVFIYTPPLC